MNEKAALGLKVPKKGTSKNEKMGKCPKTANFGLLFKQLKLFRLNFAVAVLLYFVHLLLIKMVGMLKSRGIA